MSPLLIAAASRPIRTDYAQGANALPNDGYLDQDQPYPCAACCTDTAAPRAKVVVAH